MPDYTSRPSLIYTTVSKPNNNRQLSKPISRRPCLQVECSMNQPLVARLSTHSVPPVLSTTSSAYQIIRAQRLNTFKLESVQHHNVALLLTCRSGSHDNIQTGSTTPTTCKARTAPTSHAFLLATGYQQDSSTTPAPPHVQI